MNVDLLNRLMAAGTPMDLIAEVAAELGRAEADRLVLAERRAKDRERKRPRNSAETAEGVEFHADAPLNGPPERTDQNPPLIPPTSIGGAPAPLDLGAIAEVVRMVAAASLAAEKATKAARYHRLPATWEPPAELPDKLAAKVALWPPGMLGDEADAFRAWAVNAKNENGKGRKLDWDQAYHNWLRSKHDDWQRRQPRNVGNYGTRQGRPRTLADRLHDELAGVG